MGSDALCSGRAVVIRVYDVARNRSWWPLAMGDRPGGVRAVFQVEGGDGGPFGELSIEYQEASMAPRVGGRFVVSLRPEGG